MQSLTIVSLACLAILADASAIWGHHGGHQDGQWRGEGIAKSQWYKDSRNDHITVDSLIQTRGHGNAAIIEPSAHATVIGPKDHGVSIVGPSAHATVLNAQHHEISLPAILYASQYIHHPVHEKHSLPLVHSVKHNGETKWYGDKHESLGKVATSFQTHGHGHAAIIGSSSHATVIGPKNHGVSMIAPSSHATFLSAKHHEITVPAISYASQIIHHPVNEKHSLPLIHSIKHNGEGQWYGNEHKNHKTVTTSFQTHGHGHAAIIEPSAHATVIGPKDHGVSIVGPSAHATVLNAKHHEISLPAISYASQYIHHPVHEKHSLPLVHSVKHNGESKWYGDKHESLGKVATSFKTHGHGQAAIIGPSAYATVIGPKDHGVSIIAPSSHATVLSAKHHEISLPAISYASQIIHHPVQKKHSSLPFVHSVKHNDDGQWHGEGLLASQWHGDHEVHHGLLATSVKTHDLGHAAVVGPVSQRVVVVGPQDHGAVLIAPSVQGSVVSKKHHESPLIANSHSAQIIQHPVHVPRVAHVTHTVPLVHSHETGHGKGISIIGPSGKIRSHH